MKKKEDHDLDQKLDRLAQFSEEVGGQTGRLLHWLHLEIIRPGTGVWFEPRQKDGGAGEADDDAVPKEKELPPWPDEGEEDPLEEPFGPDADGIELITEEQLEELRRGKEVIGVRPKPDTAKPGSQGDAFPVLPSRKWPYRMTMHMSDGTWGRIGPGPRQCGELWILEFSHSVNVPRCAGFNYKGIFRATLLRAIAEAYRNCRLALPECPNARVWMLFGNWNCTRKHFRGPLVHTTFKLAVACVAN